jgi:predicted amidophosphoribosyltransferase
MRRHGAELIEGADLAVPVPLHWRRRLDRGFNQAEALARELGLPVCRALRRRRRTPPQVELPADARHANVRDAFALAWPQRTGAWPLGGARPLSGAVVVLVDDVSTTGATLDACALVLKRAGVSQVRALTAARVATRRR